MGDWDESKHQRDEHGRFGGGGLSKWVEKRAGRLAAPLVDKVEKEGGFTYQPSAPKDVRVPKTGIMVSRAPSEGHGRVIEVSKMAEELLARGMTSKSQVRAEVTARVRSEVKDWMKKALPSMKALGPDHYLGGWQQTDKEGRVSYHFDISQRFETRHKERAVQAGRDRNQVSVWHIEEGKEIPTGGTGRD